MSRPNNHEQPVEARLDALLDRLAGETAEPVATDGGSELRDLVLLARAIRDDDGVEWPDDGYPLRLTDAVFAELGHTGAPAGSNGVAREGDWTSGETPGPSPHPAVLPDASAEQIAGLPSQRLDVRRLAQVAAVVVVFALATLVIAAVFRGFDEREPDSTGGFLAGDVAAHPPQLAIALLPDPNDADPDIYLTSPDGSQQTNLTDHPAADSFPAWSPDGHQLAFVSNRAGPEAVYVLDVESGDLRQLYAPALEENLHLRNLAWSPDGESIAVLRFSKSSVPGGPLSGVVVIDVDSGEAYPVEITAEYPAPAFDELPVWSPDGRRLMFETFGTRTSRLLVVDTSAPRDESNLLPIVAETTGESMSWSSTGEIALTDGEEIRIVRFDQDDASFEEERRIPANASGSIFRLAWSPDGDKLLLSVDDGGTISLWVTSADGTTIDQVPDSTTAAAPAWSTDGAHVAFLRTDTFIYTPIAVAHTLVIYDVATNAIVSESPHVSPQEPSASPFAWRPGEILAKDTTEAAPTLTATTAPTPTVERQVETPTTPTIMMPALHVKPGSWFCSDRLRMEASGFPPDEPVTVTVRNLESGASREVGVGPRANPDGEFTAELPIDLMYPECEAEATRPEGLRLQILMTTSDADENSVGAAIEVHVFADPGNGSGDPLDDPRVQEAIRQVRDFLGDPEAIFTALPIEDSGDLSHVPLEQRDPNGPIPGGVFNTFFVEVNRDAAFIANLAMNSAMAQPSNRLTVDEARVVAEAFYAQHTTFDESLTVVDERSDIYLFPDEECYTIIWQLQSDGVRLPTRAQISVSLETGLVVNYMRYQFPYDGPLTPEITEEEARQAAEQIIAEDPEFAGASIGETRLEVWYSGPDDTIDGRSAADPEMAWRLAWTFTLVDRPGPVSDHVLLIDALTGQRLEPQV